jgi:hypothetical protein
MSAHATNDGPAQRRAVFVLSHERPDLLAVCLPTIIDAAARAGAELRVIDDDSEDPMVDLMLKRSGVEVLRNATRAVSDDEPLGAWYRAAWYASNLGLRRYAIVNADMFLAPDALSTMFDAADVLPSERRGLLCAAAVRARRVGDGPRFERGGFEFCGAGMSLSVGRSLLLQDGVHVVWPFAGKACVDKAAGMVRFERDVRKRLCGMIAPQPRLAHLGVFSHT